MSSACLDSLLEKEKMREKGMGENYSLLYSMRSNMTVIESVLTMPPYVGSTSLSHDRNLCHLYTKVPTSRYASTFHTKRQRVLSRKYNVSDVREPMDGHIRMDGFENPDGCLQANVWKTTVVQV